MHGRKRALTSSSSNEAGKRPRPQVSRQQSTSDNTQSDSELWNEAYAGETSSKFDSHLLEALAIYSQRHPEDAPAAEQPEADTPEDLVVEHGALWDLQRTPEQTRSVSSNLHPSPRSKICGSNITLGISNFTSFVKDDATFVDKSLAIVDIMDANVGRVIAGMYPRRMGKTTFLQTLASFLSIIDDMSRDQRKQHFIKCSIYEFHRDFFEANFAKYPVIMLDLKAQCPVSFNQVPRYLREEVVRATFKYTELFEELMDSNDFTICGVQFSEAKVRKARRYISSFLNKIKPFSSGDKVTTEDLPGLCAMIPDLMRALQLLFDKETVLIVDEYDAPYINALCHVKDNDEQSLIQEMYSMFLCKCLKNNQYLYKGVLVGVFDMRGIGLGSGLNNVESYLAHSGLFSVGTSSNPFQRAFGFDIHDLWGLINDYIDNRWPYRGNSTDNDLFKRDLLVNCIKYFDGYRIGQVHHIFNPYVVLRFINELHQVRSRNAVCYSGHLYWVETGSTRVLEQVQTRSVDDLRRYCGYLSASFLQQNDYQSHVGPVADLGESRNISDVAVTTVGSQEQPRFPFNHDTDTGNEIANICMKHSSESFYDLHTLSRDPLRADTIIWLLYQAGYIVPFADGQVGIPNVEVHVALMNFFESIALQHNASTDALESVHEQMGICEGNLEKFATSFNSCMVLQDGLTEDTIEKTYQHLLSAYLFPATRAGFAIECEASSGSGRADISLYPEPGNRSSPDRNITAYYIFELKRYSGARSRNNRDRFSTSNRRSVAAHVFNQTIEAQTQIYERYYPTIMERARSCKMLFVIGMTFWCNRFCMVITRREATKNADCMITWRLKNYSDGPIGSTMPDYNDIGDNIETSDPHGLRTHFVQGSLVMLTV
ncbi:hypothetical protein H4S08_000321 [Coemansia sp. RSA 1365]|nr:hypothetical protein H4S08_000321 [Coemansia sp. RSA 1365]